VKFELLVVIRARERDADDFRAVQFDGAVEAAGFGVTRVEELEVQNHMVSKAGTQTQAGRPALETAT